MRMLLIAMLLLTACMPARIRRQRAAEANTLHVTDSLLQLTAYFDKQNPGQGRIILVFKNVSGQPLSFNPPNCLYTTSIILKDAAGELVSGDKVCSWEDCGSIFKNLPAEAFLSLSNSHRVRTWYSNLKPGTYTAYVIYNGIIKNSAGRYLKSDKEIRSRDVQIRMGD